VTEPLQGLEVINLIGVFYWEGDRLMVADEFDGGRDVGVDLEALVGHQLRLLAHHRPVEPINKTRWGGGCCFLENTGECHFGHEDDPGALYTFNEVGVLRVDGRQFFLDIEDADPKECNVDFLTGHRSQIVVTSIPDMDEITEKVKSFDPSNIEEPTLENLTERLSEMRDFIGELNKLKDDVDG
jgi:hypothetical protein